MGYLSPRALQGLKEYQYKPAGYTWLDDAHQPFWNGECSTVQSGLPSPTLVYRSPTPSPLPLGGCLYLSPTPRPSYESNITSSTRYCTSSQLSPRCCQCGLHPTWSHSRASSGCSWHTSWTCTMTRTCQVREDVRDVMATQIQTQRGLAESSGQINDLIIRSLVRFPHYASWHQIPDLQLIQRSHVILVPATFYGAATPAAAADACSLLSRQLLLPV